MVTHLKPHVFPQPYHKTDNCCFMVSYIGLFIGAKKKPCLLEYAIHLNYNSATTYLLISIFLRYGFESSKVTFPSLCLCITMW